MKSIKIIINMSELGAGTRGSSLSYKSIVTASHNLNSDFFLKIKLKKFVMKIINYLVLGYQKTQNILTRLFWCTKNI